MKYLIASDIHGYSKYAKVLIEKLEEEKADRLILLGDYLSYGFYGIEMADEQVRQTIEILNKNKGKIAYAVMGNSDNKKTKEVLHFRIEDAYQMLYLDGKKIMLTHGDRYHENNIEYLEERPDILIHGHTHIPRIIKYPDFISLNPGSISIPRGGSRNSYMIYENGTFFIKDVDGNKINSYQIEK